MENTLSSILQGLNSYHQRTKIDKDSLLAGKIKVFSMPGPDAQTIMDQVTSDLITAYPNPTTYEIIDSYFSGGDGSQMFFYLIVRLN